MTTAPRNRTRERWDLSLPTYGTATHKSGAKLSGWFVIDFRAHAPLRRVAPPAWWPEDAGCRTWGLAVGGEGSGLRGCCTEPVVVEGEGSCGGEGFWGG